MIRINDIEILTIEDGSIKWNGASDVAGRTLSFNYLFSPITKEIPVYKAQVGQKVEWVENGKTLFLGTIENIPYDTSSDTISINCVDFIGRLARSKCVGRFKGTLNELANNICSAFNINNGININNTHIHNIVSTGDLTYFDILNEACKIMFERYCLYMDGNTLKLAEHETVASFEIGKNIRSSQFRSNISEMVTRVLIVDDKGKVLNSVQNDDDLRQFGLFQEVYNYSKDSKDNLADAKKLLKTVNNEAIIEVNNDNNCISGRFIRIIEPNNNLNGIFEILTDDHTIGVDSVMTLGVKYVADR